ncbi:hypothetical protein ANANG_G00083170 [Anguilla anguilla]|uniref:Uncharacterized protein n=1 Tax=Anguilla anguilla TaxID=7936 RepID=A0A9D3MKC4_ANGAN|nr:hypothetical protein ANANG_G00083170 [Anguilla anguilla]
MACLWQRLKWTHAARGLWLDKLRPPDLLNSSQTDVSPWSAESAGPSGGKMTRADRDETCQLKRSNMIRGKGALGGGEHSPELALLEASNSVPHKGMV